VEEVEESAVLLLLDEAGAHEASDAEEVRAYGEADECEGHPDEGSLPCAGLS